MGKILILANNDIGLYKFRKDLIQELINKGEQVYISLPYGDFIDPLISMGCKYINTEIDRRGINPFKDIKIFVDYIKIFNKIKPDMVITYTIKPNIYGGIISRLKKVNYVINITGLGTVFQRDSLLKKFAISLYKISCKEAKVVFFENEANQNVFIKNNIVKKEQTYRLNGAGVNLLDYNFCKLPPENGEIRFLYIGRIMKEKGIDEMIDAAKRIKIEYPNVIFDFVGPLEDDYEHKFNYLIEEGIINYYGYQSNVKSFIRKSHCFVLPSYHEGMANTLLESGSVGRPLITSDIPGCKEAVREGINGYLVKVRDKNDLYEKVKKFIELSYREKVEMGEWSRKIIENNFDKSKVVNKTLKELFK